MFPVFPYRGGGIVNRLIKFCLVFLMIFACPLAFANSGPVYMTGHPSTGLLAVDKTSPLEVKEENLTFDFSGGEEEYAPIGRVTAEYLMVNPTGEDLSVQMAFPYIGNLGSASNDNIKITAGNEEVSYEVFVGEAVKSRQSMDNSEDRDENYFDFEKIVGSIGKDIYRAQNFTEDERGKLYTIEVTPESDEGLEIFVDFTFDPDKSRVFTRGFRGFERAGDKTIIHGWLSEEGTLDIFVLGQDIDFTLEGYKDGSRREKTELYKYKISEAGREVKTYLLDTVRNNSYVTYDHISDIALYNLFAKAMDEHFTNNLGYCSDDDILSYGSVNRVISLVYTVEFSKESEKTLSVSYMAFGTMDRRKTKEPLFTYDYILNPAENWKDFKNLNIKIIPPAEAPYVVESSIELKREGNVYKAYLERLPEEDLTFTLYHKNKVSMMDMAEKEISNLLSTLFMFWPLIMIFIFIIVVIIIFSKAVKNN